MSTTGKIRSVTDPIGDKIRIVIFYLGVHLTPPIKLLGLIYASGLGIWRILSAGDFTFKMPVVIFAVVVTIPFFAYVIHLMFPPSKRIEILVDAYGTNPRIILFIAKNVKRWLGDIVKFMDKQPNMDEIREAIELPLIRSNIEKLQKRFLKPSSAKRLMGGIEKKGNYLNTLISSVSESFQISRESLEELINSKVDINQKLVSEINISYDQIKAYLRSLSAVLSAVDVRTTPQKIINYYIKKIKERADYLESKRESLIEQIEWIKEFVKQKEDTVEELVEILNEPSTGKAVSKLARILSEKAKTVEDMIWLIRFANSRKGAKISELIGLKVIQVGKEAKLYWYGTLISQENLQKVRGFLGSFVRLRSEALEELWQKFKKWNKETNKLDLTQPIATGLTFGYSAALRKILQGLCKENRQLRTILISREAPGAEEILKAELIVDCPRLKCDIMPFEVIKRREIQRQIGVIFVGIESINKQGDIVHPRGGSEIIRKIKEYRKDTKVYAVGESYKVQEFTEDDIDYTKLSLFRHEYVDYVVTDHGVHEREGESWKIGGKVVNNLDCCAEHWKKRLKEENFL